LVVQFRLLPAKRYCTMSLSPMAQAVPNSYTPVSDRLYPEAEPFKKCCQAKRLLIHV